MTRRVRLAALAITITMVLAGQARAQAPAQKHRGLVDVSPPSGRHGLWLEGGFGWGEEAYKFGNDPYTPNLGKPTFNFRLGGTVNPYLRLGGEVNAWWNSYQDNTGYNVSETLTHALVIARVYPAKSLGLYLKGGAGVGWTGASLDYSNGTSEAGFAMGLGAGWEIALSKQLYLTPAVDWYQSRYEKRDDATLYKRLFNLSVSVTWQPGH